MAAKKDAKFDLTINTVSIDLGGQDVPVMDEGEIKLSEATKVGQLVAGTSSGSRYVCVALTSQLAMAARIAEDLENTVSIRVEGRVTKIAALAPYATALSELGLAVHQNLNYASVHLKAPSRQAACMGVSAFITGLVNLCGGTGTAFTMTPQEVLMLPGKGA